MCVLIANPDDERLSDVRAFALDARPRAAHVRPTHESGGFARGTTAACLRDKSKGALMFSWAIVFLVIALIAAVFGFFGLAASAAGIAKIIFVVALILAIISFATGRRTPLT